MKIKRILVACTHTSEKLLDETIKLCEKNDEVILLGIVDISCFENPPFVDLMHFGELSLEEKENMIRIATKKYSKELLIFQSQLMQAGIKKVFSKIQIGFPKKDIVIEAKTFKVDLIILEDTSTLHTQQKKNGFEAIKAFVYSYISNLSFFKSGTINSVIKESPCTVVLVK